jgi:2-polyprenyl-3-methyl-5-hydroxy-6-metoxy-1,4-benzoquinol methylase
MPMIAGKRDQSYTQADHHLRENDRYARAKYHLTMRWLRRYMRPGLTLYNIGVGSGYFNHLAVGAGLDVLGCEPDPETFALADGSKPAQNCTLFPIGLAEFARGRKPGDIIVMHDVLEHIADDDEAARQLHSITHPGTKIVLSVPAFAFLFGNHDVELRHFRRYTKKSLRKVLEPYFRITRIRYFGMASIPIVLYFSVLRRSSYPRAAAAENMLSKAYGTVCRIESYISEPIGTSCIVEMEPRSVTQR